VVCRDVLALAGADVEFLPLKEYDFPPFNELTVTESEAYKNIHPKVASADGLVLASPVYNWGLCGGLKQFIEHLGSTPPDGSLKGALFDKVVTFVCAAGLPHSYMAMGPSALSLMFDFKCIVNPYQVYMDSRCWESDCLTDQHAQRLSRAMEVMLELTTLLADRSYRSDWCV